MVSNAWVISAAGSTNGTGYIEGTDYYYSNLAGIRTQFSYTVAFGDPTDVIGYFSYGENTLDVVGTGFASKVNGTDSYSGVWTLLSTNLSVADTGTYTATFDHNSGRFEYNFAGAVPEPAPFAALGIGAMGLLIRRRRKA